MYRKFMNVIDPSNSANNLGRSISFKNALSES